MTLLANLAKKSSQSPVLRAAVTRAASTLTAAAAAAPAAATDVFAPSPWPAATVAAPRLLEGHNVLHVGGGFIGGKIIEKTMREGANVLVNDPFVRPEAAASLVRLADAHGVRAHVASFDVAASGQPEAMVRHALATLGQLNSMVYTAGIYRGGHEVSDEMLQGMFGVNVMGFIQTVKALLPRLTPDFRDKKVIAAVASVSGRVGVAGEPLYCATKGAMVNYVRSLHAGLDDKTAAGVICPSLVETPMGDRPGFDLSRAIRPEDVAEAVMLYYRLSSRTVPTIIDLSSTQSPYPHGKL